MTEKYYFRAIMQDIKKQDSLAKSRSKKGGPVDPDLSFLDDGQPLDVNQISQPTGFWRRLAGFFKSGLWTYGIVVILFFVAGVGVGIGYFAKPDTVKTAVKAEEAANLTNDDAIGGFLPDVYYRLQLADKRMYYALIADVDDDYYQLENVFYTLELSDGTTSTPQRITLARYEQQADKPESSLFLPREQVLAISPLSADSPVVEAIRDYLAK